MPDCVEEKHYAAQGALHCDISYRLSISMLTISKPPAVSMPASSRSIAEKLRTMRTCTPPNGILARISTLYSEGETPLNFLGYKITVDLFVILRPAPPP